MTSNKIGLGKGLSALMSEEYSQSFQTPGTAQAGNTSQLPLDAIHSGEFQPRTRFTEDYLQELADSIERNGVMQPIIVRPSPKEAGKYEIIAGERRWRASKLAKMATIPVIIRDIDNKLALELALVENIQRQDLTPLEEAAGYQRLINEFTYTQEELARTVGKSRSHIANLLRLLTLPDGIKRYLDDDSLSMGHARALLGADEPQKLAEKIVREGLNVRQTEALVKQGSDGGAVPNAPRNSPAAPRRTHYGKDEDIIALEESLSASLGLNVSIEDQGNQKGAVTVTYHSLTQLDDILRRLSASI